MRANDHGNSVQVRADSLLEVSRVGFVLYVCLGKKHVFLFKMR